MDHLMNQELSAAFGQLYERLPLRKSATIICANALRLDWSAITTPPPPPPHLSQPPHRDRLTYILGNPPFVGKQFATVQQKQDMEYVWGDVKGAGILDFVTAWYRKAADFITGTPVRCAFVSTNSISQGEQVGILWNDLFHKRIKIHFAHRTLPGVVKLKVVLMFTSLLLVSARAIMRLRG